MLSYRPFIEPLTAAPADPLADLSLPKFRRLENPARAELLRKVPYLRALLAQGKCHAATRHRMRYLLAGPSPPPTSPAPPPTFPSPPPTSQPALREPWDYTDLRPDEDVEEPRPAARRFV